MEPTKISASKKGASRKKLQPTKLFTEYLEDPIKEDSEWILVSEAIKILGVTRMRIHQITNEMIDGQPKIRKLDISKRLCMVSREDVMNYKEAKGGANRTAALNRIKKQKNFLKTLNPETSDETE